MLTVQKNNLCGLSFFDSPALMMFLSHPGSLGASKLRAEAPGSSCCQRGEACLEVGLWVGSNTFPGLPPLSGGWLWSQGTTEHLDVCRAAPYGGWCGLCQGKSSLSQICDGARLSRCVMEQGSGEHGLAKLSQPSFLPFAFGGTAAVSPLPALREGKPGESCPCFVLLLSEVTPGGTPLR